MAFKDLAPIACRNFAETGVLRDQLPFDADWERYFEFEDRGILSVLTARKGADLIGFVACLALPHIQHRSEICCTVNSIFLAPEHRSGTVGIRMLKQAVADFQKRGVRLFRVPAMKEQFGNILERLGFEVEETVYVKYTGET